MNELISQLWTPELTAGFVVVIVLLLVLYVLSIVWVVRDAYMRGTQWYIWAIVALVPGIGVIAYLLLRPPLLQIDRDEQELEIALKQRQLMRYGECATCGYPVEADYVICPNCLTQLKNLCRSCHRALDPAWEVCPYCATPVTVIGHRHSSPSAYAATRSAEGVGIPDGDSAVSEDSSLPAANSNSPRSRRSRRNRIEQEPGTERDSLETMASAGSVSELNSHETDGSFTSEALGANAPSLEMDQGVKSPSSAKSARPKMRKAGSQKAKNTSNSVEELSVEQNVSAESVSSTQKNNPRLAKSSSDTESESLV